MYSNAIIIHNAAILQYNMLLFGLIFMQHNWVSTVMAYVWLDDLTTTMPQYHIIS